MANDAILRLTLVGRSYCSLCDKMRVALHEYVKVNDIAIDLSEIDLDDAPEFEEQFGIRVPILILGEFPNGVEICHYHFDEALFKSYSQTHAQKPQLSS